MTYNEQKTQILADPTASYWIQKAIKALDKRDPLNAITDIKLLHLITRKRYTEIINKSGFNHESSPRRHSTKQTHP
jgi:hypothetical protein